ncbi:hypothetical protein V8C40DRAFT_180105 [Trichoderma camerunense]
MPTNSLFTAKLYPLLCRFFSSYLNHLRNHDTIPEILQPSSDCSRLETCSQTWSWHLARGNPQPRPSSWFLSSHSPLGFLAHCHVHAEPIPCADHEYRFNHACPPLTARSILGPWLIHATPVHLRFLPAVISKYASLSGPSAKRKRHASTNTHSLCRNLDHIDTPDAQVASLPNSPGPYHTFSHPARKTTTPTLYGTQRASFSTLENALWTVHSQAWASLRDTSSLVMARSRRRATVCQPMSITFLHLAPTHTGKAESTPECSSAAASSSTTKWLDSAG